MPEVIAFPSRPDRAPRPALLEAQGLGFRAGGQDLLAGINLRVTPGKRLAIMGANGSGKSLLVRLLHGLIAPSAGRVLWTGGQGAQAMVFQKPVLLRRSVRANLKFALGVRGIRGAERARRIDAALEQSRLSELADRPARVLSGGEQQRLAIARALACAPQLLFLDEPTASLDPASTALIEEALNAAHRAGIATILVTHDRGQARRMADEIAFLHAGRLVEQGPAARILTAPVSAPARAWMEGRLYLDTDEETS